MLPGKKYTPEDLVAIARRRFWFLLVPLAVVSALVAIGARLLPDTYQAEALISVVPQQVPASFVPPTVTTRLSDRLRAIQDQVLSRPRLEKLILDLNLYSDERRGGIMEDVVDRMKTRDLKIVESGPVAFRVTYLGREPVSTMRVAQEVASAFINESLVDRARLSDQTNEFLESQAEAARLRLVELEQQVVAYRLQHAGELPTEQESNLRSMGNVHTQIQSIAQARNAARQSRILLNRQLDTALQTPASTALPASAGSGTAPGPPSTTVQRLAEAKRQFELVSAQYTALHPDVQKWGDEVKDLEAKAAAEAAASPAGRGLPPGMSPAEVIRANQIDELKKQLAELDDQIARYDADERQLQKEAALYRARVDAAPKREAELTELLRNYDELRAGHSDLVRKYEQAKLAADLGRREIGEQFRLLEPATVPQRPFSPNRARLTLMGMAVGLALGVALVGLLEYRNNGFKSDKQVAAVLGLPVLAVVPVMQSEQERQRARLLRTAAHLMLGTTVAACLVVVTYTFIR